MSVPYENLLNLCCVCVVVYVIGCFIRIYCKIDISNLWAIYSYIRWLYRDVVRIRAFWDDLKNKKSSIVGTMKSDGKKLQLVL